MKRSIGLWIVRLSCAGVILALLLPAPGQANVGPQPVLPGGGDIQPSQETSIQMAAERVTITVRAATEADNALVRLAPRTYALQAQSVWYPGVAEVQAEYTMFNPTAQAVEMAVWFPLASTLEKAGWNLVRYQEVVPRIETFEVSVGGQALETKEVELPNPQGADKPALPWASFVVRFPAGVETVIQVSYWLPLQPSVYGNEMLLYYIFQTGAAWAGPIGQAELIINLPYPASAATLADIPPGKLVVPPLNISDRPASLPQAATLQGSQARWQWRNFEPSAQDDLALWILRIDIWQALEAARAACQANPQDGQAWLDLALQYFSLSYNERLYPLMFRESYLPAGLEAFHRAAELLPEHPTPHAGLALLAIGPYLQDKNAPPDALAFFQEQAALAQDLAAQQPELAERDWLLNSLFEAQYRYFHNAATATIEAATRAVLSAAETATATLFFETEQAARNAKATNMACYLASGAACTDTPVLTATATYSPAATASPTPSAAAVFLVTASPVTTPPAPVAQSGETQDRTAVIISVLGLLGVGLAVVVFWVVNRMRKSAELD